MKYRYNYEKWIGRERNGVIARFSGVIDTQEMDVRDYDEDMAPRSVHSIGSFFEQIHDFFFFFLCLFRFPINDLIIDMQLVGSERQMSMVVVR